MVIIILKLMIKGCKNMNTGSFVKGVVTGAVIGMGLSMLAVPVDERDRKRLAKKTSKVFTTLGAVADNIMDAVK